MQAIAQPSRAFIPSASRDATGVSCLLRCLPLFSLKAISGGVCGGYSVGDMARCAALPPRNRGSTAFRQSLFGSSVRLFSFHHCPLKAAFRRARCGRGSGEGRSVADRGLLPSVRQQPHAHLFFFLPIYHYPLPVLTDGPPFRGGPFHFRVCSRLPSCAASCPMGV